MKVLALSSSRVGKGGFLERAVPLVSQFIGSRPLTVAFIPFAAVQKNYEDYGAMVRQAFAALPYLINTVVPEKATSVLERADVIMTGGGNTFKLLHALYGYDLFQTIQDKVRKGTPYIGWSAGANIAGRSIATTNDMPIIQPPSFTSFGFFPFQINPHYINQQIEAHHGETRDQRLEEFVLLNPGIPVVALPEGTALQLQGEALQLIGRQKALLFQTGVQGEVQKTPILKEDLSFLLRSS